MGPWKDRLLQTAAPYPQNYKFYTLSLPNTAPGGQGAQVPDRQPTYKPPKAQKGRKKRKEPSFESSDTSDESEESVAPPPPKVRKFAPAAGGVSFEALCELTRDVSDRQLPGWVKKHYSIEAKSISFTARRQTLQILAELLACKFGSPDSLE